MEHRITPDKKSRPAPSIAREALYGNSFKSYHPFTLATGFRSYSFRCRTLGETSGPRVEEDFLIRSRLRRFNREFEVSASTYFSEAAAVMCTRVGEELRPTADARKLPESFPLRMELEEAIARRRSCRKYTGRELPLEDLATVLRSGGSITGTTEVAHARGGSSRAHFRATPSGGALYPIELHVAALNVTDLPRGMYRYDPLGDVLIPTHPAATVAQFLETFSGDDDLIATSRANAVLVLIGRPWRSMRKYGARGIRLLFFEAGAIAENVHLAAVALGLGTVDCGSVYDDEAHEVLGFDGLYEMLVHTIVLGDPG